MPTPESINQEVPQIKEVNTEAEMPASEELVSSGAQVVQKNFNAQLKDDKGQPLIQTPPTQVVTIQPPYDPTTLTSQSKGSVASSLTWLSAFWIRILKKALHFGWRVVGGSA